MSKISMGIPTVGSNKISSIVKMAYDNKMNVLFYGSPGIGKSQGVIAGAEIIAKEMGMKAKVNPPTEMEQAFFGVNLRIMSMFAPEDVGGMPYVIDGAVKFAKTGFVPTTPGLKGIIFLDEIGNAEEYKFGPLQSLLTERKVGEYSIPEGITFVLATNKTDDGTGARELPSAIRDRCLQYDIVAPIGEDFVNMMRDIGKKLHMYVEGFLLTFPGETYTFDPAKTASATLRSWEMISKSLPSMKKIEDEVLLISGMVGTSGGQKYKAWRKLSDKIDIKELLKEPTKIHNYEHDKGMLYNIALSLIELCDKDNKKIEPTLVVTTEMQTDEFAIYMLSNLLDRHGIQKISAIMNTSDNKEQIKDKVKKYAKYFN